MKLRPVLDDVTASVCALVLGTATIVGFARVFAGWGHLATMMLVAVVTQSVALLARRLGLPTLAVSAAALVIGVETVALLRSFERLWWGLPLGEAWTDAITRLSEAAEQVGDVVPFVPFDDGFGLAALLAVVLATVATDALLFGAAARIEAVLPWFAVFATVSVVGVDRQRALSSAVFVVGAALVVLAARRLHVPHAEQSARAVIGRMRGGFALATTTAVLAIVAAPLLPGHGRPALIDRESRGAVLAPLVDVRGRLTSPDSTVLFRVEASRAAYWRIAGLVEFDGSVWGLDEEAAQDSAGALDTAPSELPFEENVQRYVIEQLGGSLAPVVPSPVQLRSTTRNLYYENDSGTLLVDDDGLAPGDEYRIASVEIEPSWTSLTTATAASPPSDRTLDIPTRPEFEELEEIARTLVPDDLGPYSAAITLQTWFRTEFTYSLEAAPLNGPRAMLDFIDRRSGYCEQFAGTFAAMMRLLGHPTRVAVGFTPGRLVDPSTWEVSANHAHAWPEVWFDGFGWLLFEPTPGRGAPHADWTGVAPQQDESAPESSATTPTDSTSGTNSSTTSSTTAPDAAPTTVVESVDGAADAPTTDETGSSGGVGRNLAWLLIAAALIITWPIVVPTLARRRSRADGDRDRLVRSWRRLLAAHRLFGTRVSSSLTPLEIARRLPVKAGLDERLAIDLAEAITASFYGNRVRSALELERRTDDWCSAARRRLTRRHRIRLSIDPRFVTEWLGGSTKERQRELAADPNPRNEPVG